MGVDVSTLSGAPPGDSSLDFVMVYRPGSPIFAYKIPLSSLGTSGGTPSSLIEITMGGQDIDYAGQQLDV